ncbi:nucleotidyltransferase family protein [Veronia pacifica]|uniref:Alcohol dehydrogenase n=1 Tax=Veronia pacifica TaxID=1080227 RepID=A0A1C3EDG9_9GAMM|nr:nucleotidyltransferase family protein [Veronia pacifica]ODA31291.1 alcohol dehydrogenase [Veronia pacifica]
MTQSWRNVLIRPDRSIREALEIIDREALRVALVVSEEDHLFGVVTDGDVRRGLLNDISMSEPVSRVMSTSPITASVSSTRKQLIDLMEEKNILAVPLLDGEKICGMETLHGALNKPKLDNPVLLMAGGFGTRLRPLTESSPKPMLKIGDKPILETVIRSFMKAGFENFFISTHYMPEKIHEHFGNGSVLGINITYIHEDQPLGTGGALGLLPTDLPDDKPLIVMNGDVLTTVDFEQLVNFHTEHGADATMCVREYEYQVPYGVINGKGNKIVSMEEKPVQRFHVNTGIYVVSPHVFRSVEKNEAIDMPTLLEQQMLERDNVLMFPIHEYWLDIGRPDDFDRAQQDIVRLGI